MAARTELAPPVSLGTGRSICPPVNWSQEGFVNENPLWLLPKSRLTWTPPGVEGTSLHWKLSPVPRPAEVINRLLSLLAGEPGPISLDRIAPLYPGLIRMLIESITLAEVVSFANSGNLLRVDYVLTDSQRAGTVFYAPTEMYEFGEIQILAYEGTSPEYGQFLDLARSAIATFRVDLPDEPATYKETHVADPAKLDFNPQKQATLPITANEAADSSRNYIVHTLLAGETMRSLVRTRWPHFDENQIMTKVRELYMLNLSCGNRLEAWNLRPGMVVYLPEEKA